MARLTITRPAGSAGMAWIKAGWAAFRAAAIPWAGMSAAALLAIMFTSQIPWVGGHLVEFLSPLLVAGYMSASRAGEAGEPVTFLHLAAGFRAALQPLLVIGAVYLAGALLTDQAMRAVGGQGLQELARLAGEPRQMTPEEAEALLGEALPGLFLGVLLMTPLLMATWFSPALVLFEGFKPGNAMWWSLWACAVNWRPLLAYTLVLGLAGFVALLLPFGLGLLVFMPLAMISTYTAYRALFVPAEATAP